MDLDSSSRGILRADYTQLAAAPGFNTAVLVPAASKGRFVWGNVELPGQPLLLEQVRIEVETAVGSGAYAVVEIADKQSNGQVFSIPYFIFAPAGRNYRFQRQNGDEVIRTYNFVDLY